MAATGYRKDRVSGWRRWKRGLPPGSGLARWLRRAGAVVLVAFVGLHAAMLLRLIVRLWQSESSEGTSIGTPAGPPEAAPMTSAVAPAAGEAPIDAVGDAASLAAPAFEWAGSAGRRRAAALLAANDDLAGAINLLLLEKEAQEEVLAVGRSAFRLVQKHLDVAVLAEAEKLRTYWGGLSGAERASMFPAGEQDKLARANELLGGDLASAGWAKLDAALPESLLFALLRNAHFALSQETRCPPALIELALAGPFPGVSLAKRLYWNSPPGRRQAYSQQLAVFNAELNRRYIWPRALMMLKEAKAGVNQEDLALQAWRRKLVGPAALKKLAGFPARQATEAQGLAVWEALPDMLAYFSGRHLYTEFQRSAKAELAPVALAGNLWLRSSTGPGPGREQLLQAVRTHPAWQRELSIFDYDKARASIPRILAKLYAASFGKAARAAMQTSMNYEQAQFSRRDFDWPRLARMLRVGESTPPGIRGRAPSVVRTGEKRSWSDVAPKTVHHALLLMSRGMSISKRSGMVLLAKTYATNRALDGPPPVVPPSDRRD